MATANRRSERTQVDLSPQLREALDAWCAQNGLTLAAAIRMAVHQFLAREKRAATPPVALHDSQPEATCSKCGKYGLVAGYTAPDLKPLCDDCF